jgi:cell division protein FtsN
VPRVVVPGESEERAADHSQRRQRGLLLALGLLGVLAAAAFGLKTYRDRVWKRSADTVFVSAPAWPKADVRPVAPRPISPIKEWLVLVGAFANKKDADALAARLAGIGRPVSVIVPVGAGDSLNKVMVSGMADKATARRLADSLGKALGRPIALIEPAGTRAK